MNTIIRNFIGPLSIRKVPIVYYGHALMSVRTVRTDETAKRIVPIFKRIVRKINQNNLLGI